MVKRSVSRYVAREPYEYDCVVCGAHVVGTARSHTATKCPAHRHWKLTACTTCAGTTYNANRPKPGRNVYCSDECRSLLALRRSDAKPGLRSRLSWRQCRCGTWICQPGRKWCTRQCWHLHTYGKRHGNCATCSTKIDRRRVYCAECATTRQRTLLAAQRRRRRQKYGKSHRSRARIYGVEYELVNRLIVYERDGWQCGICTRPVDRSLKAPDPWAASLDHIRPISKGGSHTYANVQCAHHLCNSLKSDHVIGEQLALIA